MTKVSNNPFEILGISREILKSMSILESKELVKSNFRTLQKIYHPDKNKSLLAGEKSIKIIGANNLLTSIDDDSYSLLLKDYISKGYGSKKLKNLELQLTELREDLDTSSTRFRDYMNFPVNENIPSVYSLYLGKYNISIFDDIIFSQNNSGILTMDKKKQETMFNQYKYDFIFNLSEGEQLKKYKNSTVNINTKPIGSIDSKLLHLDFSRIKELIAHMYGFNVKDSNASKLTTSLVNESLTDLKTGYDNKLLSRISNYIVPTLKKDNYLILSDGNKFYLPGKILDVQKF